MRTIYDFQVTSMLQGISITVTFRVFLSHQLLQTANPSFPFYEKKPGAKGTVNRMNLRERAVSVRQIFKG